MPVINSDVTFYLTSVPVTCGETIAQRKVSFPYTIAAINSNNDNCQHWLCFCYVRNCVFYSFDAISSGLGGVHELDPGDAARKWLRLAWNPGNLSPEAAFHHYVVLAKRGLGPGLEITLVNIYRMLIMFQAAF